MSRQWLTLIAILLVYLPVAIDATVLHGESTVVQTDARHLERVFDNIVRNAQTHGEGLRDVIIDSSGDVVNVHFDDAGPGVDPSLAERIFEPFVRGEHADPTSGAGLGMAIAVEHAQRIGASLTVGASAEGGARVTVSIPLTRSE